MTTAPATTHGIVLVSTIVRQLRSGGSEPSAHSRRPSRVARMLALAHHFQRAIDAGSVADLATIARALGLARARVTQVMDLLLLAPDIQEWLLASEAVNSIEPLRERDLWVVCHARSWKAQRERFRLRFLWGNQKSCA